MFFKAILNLLDENVIRYKGCKYFCIAELATSLQIIM